MSSSNAVTALIAELLKEIVPTIPFVIESVTIITSINLDAAAALTIHSRSHATNRQTTVGVVLRPDSIGDPDFADHLSSAILGALTQRDVLPKHPDAVASVGDFVFDWDRHAWVARVTYTTSSHLTLPASQTLKNPCE